MSNSIFRVLFFGFAIFFKEFLMKTKRTLVYGLIAVIFLAFVTCDNGTGTGGGGNTPADPTSRTYTSHDNAGNKYQLRIAAAGRAAYSPQSGDTYTLTITFTDRTTSKSTGTVETVTGTTITLKHTGSETIFTVTISGSSIASDESVEIPVDSGESVTIPSGTLKPGGNVGVEERWSKWTSEELTLDYSVAKDGVCTITVGGVAETDQNRWKAIAGYSYTAKTNTSYTYVFQAWTDSGTRGLNVQHYYDEDVGAKFNIVQIDSTPTIYTVAGTPIPKGGIRGLEFQCADQLGTFYVKVLEIFPVETAWVKWGDAVTFSVDDDGTVTVNVSENGEIGGTAGAVQWWYNGTKSKKYQYIFEAWTKSGTRNLPVVFGRLETPSGGDGWPNQVIMITPAKQRYLLEYEIPESFKDFILSFDCGGDVGEFYIKIISIL